MQGRLRGRLYSELFNASEPMPDAHDYIFLFGGPVSLLIQIALCIHVYKTGRPYWWIWIIIVFPMIGCILYAVVEILPDARRIGPRLAGASWFIPRSVLIRRARELCEESDTVENRLNLASLLFDGGRKAEAEEVASGAVTGVFKDDADVIAEAAWYKIEIEKYAEAGQLLAQADAKASRFTKNRIALLNAKVLFGHKRYSEAKSALEALIPARLGEEPRYLTALCHLKLGDSGAAVRILNDMTKSFRKGSALWRRTERPWYKLAKQTLKEVKHDGVTKSLSKNLLAP